MLAALAVLLVTGLAAATPAPMCDEHAQSIAAPFPLFPSFNGEVRGVRPCAGRQAHQLGQAPTPERDHPRASADTFDRAPPSERFVVVRVRGQLQPPARADGSGPRAGIQNNVFRPPRAR